ncbi:MAG: magnesium transporter [DPANN group archaeon]|nr:magnesium transporter [DPANN group archaeon]
MDIVWKIFKESSKVLIIASFISTIGGVGLEAIKQKIILFVPFLILLPALNDMIGDFGTIISSRFTTLLYLGKVGWRWSESEDVRTLIREVGIVSMVSAVYVGFLAGLVSYLKGYVISIIMLAKILLFSVMATATLVSIILLVAVIGGIAIYRKNSDPNNFLIPLTTSFADLGSLLLFAILLHVFF